MTLNVRIEELVLRGIGAGMGQEIRAGMERELAHLFRSAAGAAPLGHRGDVSRLDAGSFRVTSSATGKEIGAQLARSVYRGIVR